MAIASITEAIPLYTHIITLLIPKTSIHHTLTNVIATREDTTADPNRPGLPCVANAGASPTLAIPASIGLIDQSHLRWGSSLESHTRRTTHALFKTDASKPTELLP